MDVITSTVRSVAKSWREEAEKRRTISKADPIADTLDFCAGELAARLHAAEHEAVTLTVEAYAETQGVTPQTVRTWIRQGTLPAQRGPKGYRIAKGATRIARSA